MYGQRGVATKTKKGMKKGKIKNIKKYKVDGNWVAIYKSEHIMVKNLTRQKTKNNLLIKKNNSRTIKVLLGDLSLSL
jgi:hypothetical protein